MATVNADGGVDLSMGEQICLAYHMAADRLSNEFHGPEWEDAPLCSEGSWLGVERWVDTICDELRQRAKAHGNIIHITEAVNP